VGGAGRGKGESVRQRRFDVWDIDEGKSIKIKIRNEERMKRSKRINRNRGFRKWKT
jgi:hypothetical protein